MSVKGCSYNIYKTFRNSFALGADNFYASFIAVVVAGSRGLRDLPKVCGNSSHARTGALSARACVRAPFRAWRLVPGSVASFPEITRGCVPPCLPPSRVRRRRRRLRSGRIYPRGGQASTGQFFGKCENRAVLVLRRPRCIMWFVYPRAQFSFRFVSYQYPVCPFFFFKYWP